MYRVEPLTSAACRIRSLKARPGRMVNLSVFSSDETDGIAFAASGWRTAPAGAGLSG